MRRRSLLLGVGSSAGLTLLGRPAAADAVGDVLEKITEARKDIKTLQAPFEQTRSIGLLASDVVSTGKLWIVRPDRLRWDLFEPDNVTYWIGPEGLSMANKDGVVKIPKASATKFAAVLADLMIMLGGDVKKLRKRYNMSVKTDGESFTLSAKPIEKNTRKHINKLRLTCDGDASVIRKVEIIEKNDDSSVIVFGDYIKNEEIDPEKMKPPKKKKQ